LRYKCIIFDCDGVLVDSETICNQVMVDLANEHGANIDLAYAMTRYVGTSLDFVIKDIESIIQKKLPSNFESEYRRISFIRFQQEIQPVKGIREVLEQLEVPFCVASNGPLNKMALNLDLTGLSKYFRGKMFSAYDINAWKPDPKLFLTAAKTLGFDPKDCAVVEDSPAGIKAGIAGGFDVFAFDHAGKMNAYKQDGVTAFTEMSALLELLKKA
jgi:HAD superfamily hydrolase (TIGR01509 family)